MSEANQLYILFLCSTLIRAVVVQNIITMTEIYKPLFSMSIDDTKDMKIKNSALPRPNPT